MVNSNFYLGLREAMKWGISLGYMNISLGKNPYLMGLLRAIFCYVSIFFISFYY